MTEKKDMSHSSMEEQPLTAQQQQELHEQEQYFPAGVLLRFLPTASRKFERGHDVGKDLLRRR